MNRLLHIAATALSILLHPLFVPAYGMVLFCLVILQYDPVASNGIWWFLVGGTFLLTGIVPLTGILILYTRHKITNLNLSDPVERQIPYLITLAIYVIWSGLFTLLFKDSDFFIRWATTGATIALAIVMIINRYWKISAHLCAMGGLLGGILDYALATGKMPTAVITTVLILCLLLMYARLYLNAHTSLQVVAGLMLGLVCTTLPCLLTYA